MKQYSINIQTQGRGTIAIGSNIDQLVQESGIDTGLCHIFIHHTSASLILTENADSDVRRDLENYFSRIVEDGDPAYFHDAEGNDWEFVQYLSDDLSKRHDYEIPDIS